MLNWVICNEKPKDWQGLHILKCRLMSGDTCIKNYFMYCDVIKRTKRGTLKIKVYGERWKNVKGKPKIRYLELHEQNRVVTYNHYWD